LAWYRKPANRFECSITSNGADKASFMSMYSSGCRITGTAGSEDAAAAIRSTTVCRRRTTTDGSGAWNPATTPKVQATVRSMVIITIAGRRMG